MTMLMESSLYIDISSDKNTDNISNAVNKETRMIGEGINFDRIRRITGYLVGLLNRFNNAKLCEVKDRVCHVNKIM